MAPERHDVTAHYMESLRNALEGRYHVEREIAVGGMATVYLALDLKHQRRVALKTMHSSLLDHAADRFVREIRVTARLSHPHILPLLDSGEALGVPYYVMPFVEGETLRDRLARETRLSLDDAVHVALEVADALAYAHAQGVIHRDIKPANILLSGRHALVADFGVAKAMSSSVPDDSQTQVGLILGTLAYMSPEQAVGEAFIDSRSDIFSLGAVLYEMLVGEKAFAGATQQEMLARRFLDAAPSAQLKRAEVPAEVDRVIARALASDPADRYATAGEFEEALTAAWRSGAFFTGAIRIAGNPKEVPSLAVLPFENLSGDAENEYLSDGITEEILTSLARRRTIRVCARVSSFAMRKSPDDVRAIASRLGVRNVLTGTVRRIQDRLRVSVQLIDARDGFQRWSERYDRTLADVFAIQDEIGASIATALNATLLGEEMPAPPALPPPSIEVYETFLRGRFFWNRRTSEGTRRAIECLRQAIRMDPSYAPAHAGLADAWVTQAIYGLVAPSEAMPQARQSAEAALALNPALAEARAALATVVAAYDWDLHRAETMFRQAIALNPQYPAAHQGLAIMCLTPSGRSDAALDEMHRALTLDPLSPVLRVTLSSVLLYAREYEKAVDATRSVLDLDPIFAPAHYFLCQSFVHLGELQTAIVHGEHAVEFSGSSSETLAALGLALAVAGRQERAREISDSLAERARSAYVSPTHRAHIHLGLGETDVALDLLAQAALVRAPDLIWLGVRPVYDAVRGEPRFQALLKQLKLDTP